MDIQSALQDYGIPFRRSGKENEVWICCPFCLEEGETIDTKFRLGLNLVNGWMHCFNCGKSSKDEMYTWRELERVWKTSDLSAAQSKPKKKKIKIRLPEDFEILRKVSAHHDHWMNMAYEYVRRRRVTDRQIQEKEIGYSMDGPMAYRVVFPVRDEKGKLQGLVGRDFTGKREPKYKNSIGDKILYNVRKKKKPGVVLVEGPFDTLAVERGVRHLPYDVNGVLGHSLTDKQWEQLEDYEQVILWPDPDRAGLIGEGKSGVGGFLGMAPELLRRKKKVLLVTPKMGEGDENYDPSDMFTTEIEQRVKHAKVYSEELVQRIRAWLIFKEE